MGASPLNNFGNGGHSTSQPFSQIQNDNNLAQSAVVNSSDDEFFASKAQLGRQNNSGVI